MTEVDVVPPKTRNRPPSTAPGASARAGGPAAPAVQVATFHSHVSDRPAPVESKPQNMTTLPVPVSEAQYVSTLVSAAVQSLQLLHA